MQTRADGGRVYDDKDTSTAAAEALKKIAETDIPGSNAHSK